MKKSHLLQKVTFGIVIAMIALFFAVSLFVMRDENALVRKNNAQPLKIEGIYTDFATQITKPLPSNGDFGFEEKVYNIEIKGKFDREIPENEIISFRLDNMQMEMYINDKLAFSHGLEKETIPYLKSSGSDWQFYKGEEIKKGDSIKIVLKNHYTNHVNSSFHLFLDNMYIGNPVSIISGYLQNTAVSSLLAVFIILFGFFELGYAFILRKAGRTGLYYLVLGGLSVFAGIWMSIDFNVTNFYFPYPYTNNVIESFTVVLCLIFIMLYVSLHFHDIKRKLAIVSTWAISGYLVYMTYAQLSGIHDFYDFNTSLYGIGAILLSLSLLFLFLELKKTEHKEERFKIKLAILLLLGVILDVALSYYNLLPFVLFQVAFFIFNCIQLSKAVSTMLSIEKETANIELLKMDHERQNRILEYQMLLNQATNGLYETINEVDLTNNHAASEATEKYFESLGLSANCTIEEALKHIAQNQIKEEFREEYVHTFSPQHVVNLFKRGIDHLAYEFMISQDSCHYYWVRMNARIFYWNGDNSLRMIVYRQNIDDEKCRELELLQQATIDPLTKIDNRKATENQVSTLLMESDELYAFYLLDLDDFKWVNDNLGHIMGDKTLIAFADILKTQFPEDAIVGRIGGDEFLAFHKIHSFQDAQLQAESILWAMQNYNLPDLHEYQFSASIGIAFNNEESDFQNIYHKADLAMYKAKEKGKNQFSMYDH